MLQKTSVATAKTTTSCAIVKHLPTPILDRVLLLRLWRFSLLIDVGILSRLFETAADKSSEGATGNGDSKVNEKQSKAIQELKSVRKCDAAVHKMEIG